MPLDDELLREARASRDRLVEVQHEAERARAHHHHAVRRLHAGGGSMREIAESLGLSHQRIHQIVDGGSAPVPRKLRDRLGRLRSDCAAVDPEAFARFGPEARQALARAQGEARAREHGYLGTEHVLLGLLGAERGLAARILSSLGVDRERPRPPLAERLMGQGATSPAIAAEPAASTDLDLPLTARTKQALDLAVKEAGKARSMYAETEHLLLGIVRVRDGVAARVLRDLRVDEDAVRGLVARAERRCSFCARGGLEVGHMVSGPGVFICDGCVEGTAAFAPSVASCDFCGRGARQGARVVAAAGTAICERCVALCREIQAEERS